jgi:Family of unknown function (DUF5947)
MTNQGQMQAASEAFGTLRQFARKQRPVERCELCSTELSPHHPHLIELAQRKLTCACDPCAMLFSGQANPKYKRVPRRVRALTDFQMTDAQWDGLLIPINMAFFFSSSIDERVVALYPSPAGATESLLALETWNSIVELNPELEKMGSDVEALLVNRVGQNRGVERADYFILPIDECYKLVGLIRTHWKGLSGGTEVWHEIANFFSTLRDKAEVPSRRQNA